ncbi:MAG: aminotransferase [Steroidobacteraceae bacterium]
MTRPSPSAWARPEPLPALGATRQSSRTQWGKTRLAPPSADGCSLPRLRARDRSHFLHPFTNHRRMREQGTQVFVRGEGIHLIDANGRRYIDGMSGLWCVTLGYSQSEIVAAATAKLNELPFCSSFFGATHPAAIELADTIASLTPTGLDQVFFSNSGSEANDTAIRAVRHYWELRAQPRRRVIISRHNAYHGSTYIGASLGGFACMHAQGGLPLPEIMHIRQPYHFAEGKGEAPEQFGLTAARALEEAILRCGPDRVAAFIAEPIQAAGGVIIPPATYWPAIERIAQRYGVLVIADEVVCGFGRTGVWFGCQHQHFTPDVMTMSKGLTSGYAPLAATVLSHEIAEVIRDHDGEFEHGFTCSAHPVSCAVANKTIEILHRERVVETIRRETGPYLAMRLGNLGAHASVGEVRSVGLMAAIELRRQDASSGNDTPAGLLGQTFRRLCADADLIVRAEGDTVMLAPPLISTRNDIDNIVARLDSVCRKLTRTAGRS